MSTISTMRCALALAWLCSCTQTPAPPDLAVPTDLSVDANLAPDAAVDRPTGSLGLPLPDNPGPHR